MLPQVLRVLVGGQWGVVALLDLLAQRVQVHLVAVEGALQRRHLVQQAPQRPEEFEFPAICYGLIPEFEVISLNSPAS